MTPARNNSIGIDYLSSSDEEELSTKYKCDDKTVKRKIDNNLDNTVESKKHLENGEKTTEENSSSELRNHFCCLPQQVSDKKTNMDATNKCFESQPIVNKQQIPLFSKTKLIQPLAFRDNKQIENIDQSTIQKQSSNQVKTKYFDRRDMVQENAVLYEFLTKGVDIEDINYLKQRYESLLFNNSIHCWLNETQWISHPDILLYLSII